MSNLEDKLRDVLTKLIQDTWDVSGEGHNGEYSMLTHPGGKQYTDDEILADVIRRLADYHGSAFPIDQIIQAFKDEGWRDTNVYGIIHVGIEELKGDPRYKRQTSAKTARVVDNLKTGPEWYDQLIKEVDHEKIEWPENASKEYIAAVIGNVYLAAARRASGMEEKK